MAIRDYSTTSVRFEYDKPFHSTNAQAALEELNIKWLGEKDTPEARALMKSDLDRMYNKSLANARRPDNMYMSHQDWDGLRYLNTDRRTKDETQELRLALKKALEENTLLRAQHKEELEYLKMQYEEN